MNELMVAIKTVEDLECLKSEILRDELKSAIEQNYLMKQSSKEFAKTIGGIVLHELYTDDFEKKKDFSNFIGVSPSNLSKYAKYAKLIDEYPIFSKMSLRLATMVAYEYVNNDIDVDELLKRLETFVSSLDEVTENIIKECLNAEKGIVIESDDDSKTDDDSKGDNDSKGNNIHYAIASELAEILNNNHDFNKHEINVIKEAIKYLERGL